jgi:hypothetical protein
MLARLGCQPSSTLSATASMTIRRSPALSRSRRSGQRCDHTDPSAVHIRMTLACASAVPRLFGDAVGFPACGRLLLYASRGAALVPGESERDLVRPRGAAHLEEAVRTFNRSHDSVDERCDQLVIRRSLELVQRRADLFAV